MIVGVLKEQKAEENRAALTPAGVELFHGRGHTVLLETGTGIPSGFEDAEYENAGASIMDAPEKIFQQAEMILRVKEPQPFEYEWIREGQIYFSYLHLAASESLTHKLMETKAVFIAYETIRKPGGSLPLLTPMSEVAGAMAVQEGAKYLETAQGGGGVLIGGVPGVEPALVLVIGGGVVGLNASKKAAGMGARVHVLDVKPDRLRYLSDILPINCFPQMSNPAVIRDRVARADIVIGAPLVPGEKTPILVDVEMVKSMKKGAVLIDVSIDQGGCFETSRETTHADPVYVQHDVVHYAVSNMPGAVPRTSTVALTNATLPYALQIADRGWAVAARENPEIKEGINIANGKVIYAGVADTFGMAHTPVDEVL